MTPEQRERKNAADRARRLRMKAGTAPAVPAARPIEPGGIVAPTAPASAAAVVAAKQAATAPVPMAPPKVIKPPKAKPGGKRVGAGAPVTVAERMRVISFKGTKAHYDAFHAAGAGEWLRGVLEAGVAAKHIKVPK